LIVESDKAFPSDSPVCTYWLTRCEGFTVRAGSRVLGVVESIAGGPLGLAETLDVRSRHRERLLDVGRVRAVIPGRRLVVVEPAAPRIGPAAAKATRGVGHTVALVAQQLVRLAAFLVARIATGIRVSAVTAGRLARDELYPRVRDGVNVLIDEVERLTLLDGQPRPEEAARPTEARAQRRVRRNRARELRQRAREEEEQLRITEVARQVLP